MVTSEWLKQKNKNYSLNLKNVMEDRTQLKFLQPNYWSEAINF